MKNWREVPVPPNMQDLNKDERGFPIPFVVLIDKNGQSHFKINDEKKNEVCIAEKRCNICGKPISPNEHWFVGGMLSAFHPQGAFNDTSVHHECGVYALQVCPYMAYTQYQAKENIDKTINKLEQEDIEKRIFFNPTQDTERLAFFCFVNAPDYDAVNKFPYRFIHPVKISNKCLGGYLNVEYWLDGEKISSEKAKEILKSKGKQSFLP